MNAVKGILSFSRNEPESLSLKTKKQLKTIRQAEAYTLKELSVNISLPGLLLKYYLAELKRISTWRVSPFVNVHPV
ncbi:MAG TPA: hypothetical protein DC047_09855 [Blastocatellia bacterium]|nr:hypothetical protein [Blastocatellia bacterium]